MFVGWTDTVYSRSICITRFAPRGQNGKLRRRPWRSRSCQWKDQGVARLSNLSSALLVRFFKNTRTIQVPSFPLTDTLASSLDGLHSRGSRNLELTRISHRELARRTQIGKKKDRERLSIAFLVPFNFYLITYTLFTYSIIKLEKI